MKEILLTQGKVALVDDSDYDSLNRHKWYASKTGYCYYAERDSRMSNSKRRHIEMHRVILNAPDGVVVDHINGDGLDNRRSNLRLCTYAENQRHQRLSHRNTTGYKGVTFKKQRISKPYHANIGLNNKLIHIGCYRTAEEAARAYDLAALKCHGEFAMTNRMLGLLS